MKVTLLGTGTPVLNIHRFGMSTLVEAGGQTLLFDAGRGVAIRLHQAKVRLRDVTAVFITHLHSDHITGLPDLYAMAPLGFDGRRAVPLDVWGPQGVATVGRGIELMFTENNRMRLMAKELVPEATTMSTHDIPSEGGMIYDKGGVQVTAFLVNHGHATPAYGYRIDDGDHAVVLSGDTTYAPNVIRHAQGVELLVHCVAIGSRRLEAAAPAFVQRYYDFLASPEMAGRILHETRPRLAVFSHISLYSRAVDHVAGAACAHVAAADPGVRTEAEPRGAGLFGLPPAHVQADLRDEGLGGEHLDAVEAGPGDSTDAGALGV